jgi:TetR/AcrR family transcriptional repressor of nem operon
MAARHDSKTRLLDAALKVVRTKGYNATRVEDICAAAGVTKGSFFHHFRSKDDLALAAVAHWVEMTGGFFAEAAYHAPADPLDRLLAYVDFRKAIIEGDIAEFTCLVGTMTQEIHESHPALRDACAASILGHAATLEPDIEAAMRQRGIEADWTPASLARHTQAVLQGAFILAKATGDRAVARESVDHLKLYIELLFSSPSRRKDQP